MNRSIYVLIVFLVVFLSIVAQTSGQNVDAIKGQDSKEIPQNVPLSSTGGKQKDGDADSSPQVDNKKNDATKTKPHKPKLSRWLDLQTATLALRYAYNQTSSGMTTFNRMQHSEIFKAAFKFDKDSKYTLNAGLSSGPKFILSWNNTGIGTDGGKSTIYLKELFFSAKPVTGLELQYGGLYILRGENTEITSYDNDGYIVGQRISIKRPKELFFDEISVTYGYLGDTSNPDLNRRFYRLKHSNYHQFLVTKNLGKRVSLSTDYTFQDGAETMREAVKVKWNESRVIDSFRFENYQRMDVNPAYGFSLSAEKTLFKRLNLNGGYITVDKDYGGLNADRYGSGRRVFLVGSYKLSDEFSLTSYITQSFHNSFPVTNHTWFDIGLTYNLKTTLQRAKLF